MQNGKPRQSNLELLRGLVRNDIEELARAAPRDLRFRAVLLSPGRDVGGVAAGFLTHGPTGERYELWHNRLRLATLPVGGYTGTSSQRKRGEKRWSTTSCCATC